MPQRGDNVKRIQRLAERDLAAYGIRRYYRVVQFRCEERHRGTLGTMDRSMCYECWLSKRKEEFRGTDQSTRG
jgi:hypothetical protein